MHSEMELALAKSDVLMDYEGDVLGSGDGERSGLGREMGPLACDLGVGAGGREEILWDSAKEQRGPRAESWGVPTSWVGCRQGKDGARRLGRTSQGARSRMAGESGHQGSQGKGQFYNGAGQQCQMPPRD